MTSYQHSHPGNLQIDLASADENDPLYASSTTGSRRLSKSMRLVAILVLGLAAILVLAGMNNPEADSQMTLLQSSDKDTSGMPDYNSKEGQYDWQKCKESNDPDCWKNEGKRVGGFWKNFGQRMKSFWQNLFGKKEEDTTTMDTTTPATEKVKKTKERKEKEEPKM
jgi:hypothetical protein